jgi:acylphosphatase
MNEIARHVVFRGHVQGVGFRFTTHHIARGYDVTGFVRNVPDGTVEMWVQGPQQDVDGCLDAIQEEMAGYIHQTQIDTVPCTPAYTAFEITF